MRRVWVLVFVFVALSVALAPTLARYDPLRSVPADQFTPPGGDYLLGTDHLGRDVLSRLLWGGRSSLLGAVLAAGLAAVVGTLGGGLAGVAGGWVDRVMMRSMDVLLAFPSLMLAIALVALLGVGERQVVLAVGVSLAPGFSRVVRAAVLTAREHLFVEAAQSFGASPWHIFRVHILPAIWSQLVALFIVNYTWALLNVASLEFLGLNGSPSDPSWGGMLNEGRRYLRVAPWIALAPGILLTLTVIAINDITQNRELGLGKGSFGKTK